MNPNEVLSNWAMRSREDRQQEKAAAQKAAAQQDFREGLVDAARRQGIPIPTIYDTFRRVAAGDAFQDRVAEQQRSQRLADREAKVAELELAGYRGRSVQEAFADYGRSCAIIDAREAREAANARAVKQGGPVPWPEPVLAPMRATRAATVEDDGVIARARARQAARSTRYR
jgi:hypothetical protein